MRTHYLHQLRLDFEALPYGAPTAQASPSLRALMLPLHVAAAFARRSKASLEATRKGPHGLEHVRNASGHVRYTVGGLLDYCARRGHAPDWSAVRVAQPLDAGAVVVVIPAKRAARHVLAG